MKTLKTLIAAFAFALAGTVAAQAQSFSYGITAGYNLSKVKVSGYTENFSSDNRAGWFLGPKIAFNTVLGIGVDAALEYSQRKLYTNINDTRDTETYRTIEIPINLRYNIGLGKKAGVYIATGPQFGFSLQKMDWSNVGTGSNFSKENMNTTWNIGGGLRLLNHFEVGIGYNFALGKIGKAIVNEGTNDEHELKYKTNTFQVQLTYLF